MSTLPVGGSCVLSPVTSAKTVVVAPGAGAWPPSGHVRKTTLGVLPVALAGTAGAATAARAAANSSETDSARPHGVTILRPNRSAPGHQPGVSVLNMRKPLFSTDTSAVRASSAAWAAARRRRTVAPRPVGEADDPAVGRVGPAADQPGPHGAVDEPDDAVVAQQEVVRHLADGGPAPGCPRMASSSWCCAAVTPASTSARSLHSQEAAQPVPEREQPLVVGVGHGAEHVRIL